MNSRLANHLLSATALILVGFLAGCGRTSSTLAPQSSTASAAGDDLPTLQAGAFGSENEAEEAAPESPRQATLLTGPTVITESGDYRLAADFEVKEGDGIVVKANNVRVWLGERKLTGPGNKVGRAIVLDGVRNVLVLGGRVERFGLGAAVLGSSDCRVSGLQVTGGDETADPANGNPPQIGVMLVNSSQNRISRNSMSGVNLGIFIRGGRSYENIIRRNSVVAGKHGLLAICYNPAAGEGVAGPQHDRVSLNLLSRFSTGISASAGSSENYFVRNRIQYINAAYADANGTNVFENNQTEQVAR